LVKDHVLELLEWTKVKVGVLVQDRVLEVAWILLLLGIHIEEDGVSFLDADHGVVKSLTRDWIFSIRLQSSIVATLGCVVPVIPW
jgi:hypothetical protein